MKLPGGDHAIVDIDKLLGYCLSPAHPRGRHKARVFSAALGLTLDDVEYLKQRLLHAAREADAIKGDADPYGQRYTIDFEIVRGERRAMVRSAWIIRTSEVVPRLTSCYILSEGDE